MRWLLRLQISNIQRCARASNCYVAAHLVVSVGCTWRVSHVCGCSEVFQGGSWLYWNQAETEIIPYVRIFGPLLHAKFEHSSGFTASALPKEPQSMSGHLHD